MWGRERESEGDGISSDDGIIAQARVPRDDHMCVMRDGCCTRWTAHRPGGISSGFFNFMGFENARSRTKGGLSVSIEVWATLRFFKCFMLYVISG